MDACTYESITGLKNYYGFKSLLKNGAWTQRYSCDDDTIVFNRIESYTWSNGGFSLNPNQVGVILNMSNEMYQATPTQWVPESIVARDIDNQIFLLNGYLNVKGIVITNTFNSFGSNFVYHNIVLAVFDLY